MKESIKNIFVAINFSDSAENAIKTGIAMCKRHKATLHLIHINKDNMFIYPAGKNAGNSMLFLQAEMAKLDELEMQAKAIQNENHITCFYHSSKGPFHEALASKAEDFYCDLIIIEKSFGSRLFSFFKPRSAYQLLKHVACPVLTVPSDKKYLSFKKVFFPIRPILSALEKIEIAMPIIKKNKSKVSLFAPLVHYTKSSEIETSNNLINQADYLMSRDNIEVEKEIDNTQDMAREVIKRAVEKKSDLIIITASFKKGIMSFFKQNYTERVIQNSPIPVLSVKLK